MPWLSTGSPIPLQNRVLPSGEIVAIPARGDFTGNRGIIHVADKELGTSRWSHHAWICCTLDWQGRKRAVMTGRKWTELFFLDEAVAMAAGHRPCGYCRRADYQRFVDAWTAAVGAKPSAKAMDRALHQARIIKGTRQQKRHHLPVDALPNGVMIWHANQAHLVQDDTILPFTSTGYTSARRRPQHAVADVLTPAPMVAALEAGYQSALHQTAHL
ncbi:hypothetical protein [Loktanella sp. Alg231-35]|uniref:hypothetical protein n=1 Tax=Loktanella sp. Alg231-35 TaxID=1922220 RepID=UPI001F18E0D9|nr:hypothetical protein [Loktanella sp. Alg231-35]